MKYSLKALLLLISLAFLNITYVKCENTCFIDDFEEGYSIILPDECSEENYKPLTVKDYSESDAFEKPVNSTKYISSSSPNYGSCLINNKIKIMQGTTLVFRLISYFDGNGIAPQCFVDVNEVDTGIWIASDSRPFKDNKEWQDWGLVFTKEAEVVIRVSCSPVNGDSILAIDNIRVSANSVEDCSIIIPTTTTEMPTTSEQSSTTTEPTPPTKYLCLVDNFESGVSTVFNSGCDRVYPDLVVRNYVDGYIFNNPKGSTSYLTTFQQGYNCLERRFNYLKNPVFVFHVISRSIAVSKCYVNVYEYTIGQTIYSQLFNIKSSEAKDWRVDLSNLKMGSYKILLLCDAVSNQPSFAIDYIEVYSDRECKFNVG